MKETSLGSEVDVPVEAQPAAHTEESENTADDKEKDGQKKPQLAKTEMSLDSEVEGLAEVQPAAQTAEQDPGRDQCDRPVGSQAYL